MSKQSSRGRAWQDVAQRVLERDGYQCQLQFAGCLGEANTVDHIIPKAKGGGDEETNLLAACHICNGKKSDNLMVRTNWFDPAWWAAGV